MGQGEINRRRIEDYAQVILLLGIFFLRKIMDNNGIAYFTGAYILYLFVWIIVGRGEASVLSKMIKGRGQRGRYRNLLGAKMRIMVLQILGGICGVLLLAFPGSRIMEGLFGMPHGAAIVKILAAALFLRNVNEVFCGFIRGEGKELPVAAVFLVRSVLYILISLLLGKAFREYGVKVGELLLQTDFQGMYAAIGVSAGVAVSELVILLYLFVTSKLVSAVNYTGTRMLESIGEFAVNMYGGRAEKILTGLLLILPYITGISIYAGHTADQTDRVADLGLFVGTFLIGGMIAFKILDIMVLPLVARVNSYTRKADVRLEKTAFEYGIHAMVIWGLYFTALLITMADQFSGLMVLSEGADVAELFLVGGGIILFTGIANYFGKILFLMDKRLILLACLGIMNIVFIICMSVMGGQNQMGIDIFAYAGLFASAVLCFALGFCMFRESGIGVDWIQDAAVPLGAVLASGVLVYFMGKFMLPHMGNFVTIVLCALFYLVIYFALLLILRNIREPELKSLPGGRILGWIANLIHT